MTTARIKPLTARQVDALSETSVVGGVPGLECVVSASGTKSWRLLYRVSGDATQKRRSLGLGRHSIVTLGEARTRAADALRLASNGEDPKLEREERSRRRKLTVKEAFDEYIVWCRAENVAATARDKQSVFENHVLKDIGPLPLSVLRRRDVAKLIDRLSDRPARRRTVYAYLRHFLQWSAERELIETNPCALITTPKTVTPRDRVMSDEEIRCLWNGTSVLAVMSKLQLLTAQRTGSIARMRWSDLDLDIGIWQVPAEAMKSRRPHLVPLSSIAIKLLSDWPRLSGAYLFGVGSNGEKPFNGRSKGMKRMRAAGVASDWRLHDLRRTAVTLAQRGGASIDEIRALTQHKVPGVIGVYARHGYDAEKREVTNTLETELAKALTRRDAPVPSNYSERLIDPIGS